METFYVTLVNLNHALLAPLSKNENYLNHNLKSMQKFGYGAQS